MTQRSAAGDALRSRIREIVDRPQRFFAWSVTGDVRGPDAWRRTVGEALQDWRLLSRHRRIMTAEAELFRSGLAEILAIQIEGRLSPVFQPLQRIEWQTGKLAARRREPWAPSTHQVNR